MLVLFQKIKKKKKKKAIFQVQIWGGRLLEHGHLLEFYGTSQLDMRVVQKLSGLVL